MQVTVVLDQRFQQTPDGAVWTDGAFPHSFFERYLQVFERVRVLARTAAQGWARPAWQRVDGQAVRVVGLPYFVGPRQYMRLRQRYRRAIRDALTGSGAYILRTPGHAAGAAAAGLIARSRPFAVEVVGDPYDAYSPGACPGLLRPLFRRMFTQQLREQCQHAAGAAYVTCEALQRRYPAGPHAFTGHYSSIELPDSSLAPQPRKPIAVTQAPRLIHVGSLEHLYKAPDTLLEALGALRKAGVTWPLTIVGDGRMRGHLEALAARLGVADQVKFRGQLSGRDAVFQELDAADLFVLASRQEGLPRATIEAMARALPCIGSTAGGLPELLDAEVLVPPANAEALADCLLRIGGDPTRMAALSKRNLGAAAEYTESVLRERRNAFYRQLKDVSR